MSVFCTSNTFLVISVKFLQFCLLKYCCVAGPLAISGASHGGHASQVGNENAAESVFHHNFLGYFSVC